MKQFSKARQSKSGREQGIRGIIKQETHLPKRIKHLENLVLSSWKILVCFQDFRYTGIKIQRKKLMKIFSNKKDGKLVNGIIWLQSWNASLNIICKTYRFVFQLLLRVYPLGLQFRRSRINFKPSFSIQVYQARKNKKMILINSVSMVYHCQDM